LVVRYSTSSPTENEQKVFSTLFDDKHLVCEGFIYYRESLQPIPGESSIEEESCKSGTFYSTKT